METRRAPEGRTRPEPDWQAVKRWPGLRGEAKLAWRFLKDFGGGIGTTVVVTAADVGADQGTSSTAGRRAIESLALEGLLELVERAKGRWTVYLPNPLDVARARRSRGCDGQGELFDLDDEPLTEEPETPPTVRVKAAATETSATEAGALPSPRQTSETSECARFYKDLDLGDFGDLGKGAQARFERRSQRSRGDGSERATVATEAVVDVRGGASRIDSVLLKIASREPPRPAEQERRVEETVQLILGRVQDPQLRLTPVVRVATAVHEGAFPDGELRRILAKLDDMRTSGRLTCEPWRYFVGACHQRFLEKGLAWPSSAK